MDLSARSTRPEEMDADNVDATTHRRCLAEVAVLNRVTLAHRATLRWLARETQSLPAGSPFSVLDVGCGQGDLLRAIARWAKRHGRQVRLAGIDLNPRSTLVARDATPSEMSIDYQTADVFSYTPSKPVDFIVTSQFTHHLSDHQIVTFLTWLETNSLHGWHISDLHRHALAYRTFPLLAGVMGCHRIVRSDGLISIARSFRRREWQAYLDEAGLRAKISWHPAFRLCVSPIKTESAPTSKAAARASASSDPLA
jgi:2-polyprenyl-3-methyl-5-hydroxy-6-metoxy-1,4-benzoquinol methylase